MASRLNLHTELVSLLGSDNVYFQPPESVKLKYPCIVYGRERPDEVYADNKLYVMTASYQLTIIDRDPDSEIYIAILNHFPMASYERNFQSDNLNHDVITLYY